MSRLLVRARAPDAEGCVLEVTPRSAGWKYVGFRVCRLTRGRRITGGAADIETGIVILSGTAHVRVGERMFGDLGGRSSVFDDAPPGAVYSPAGARYEITASSDVEVALCTAPGRPGSASRLIGPETMTREVRGKGTNTRYVRNILPDSQPADSLLIVEVITPGGNWSSYPPHKHDSAADDGETELEETYYHRLNPSQGFALQRVYTDDRSLDETICVEDGSVVLVPRGYHPVAASHGYDLYYLNVMAGPRRKWKFRNDPAHEWILRG